MNLNHGDYDRQEQHEDSISARHLQNVLEHSLAAENELMRTYLITAERVHEDDGLKEKLQNFAEGNAKRTRQLMDEIDRLK